MFWKTFFSGVRLKNFCEDVFFFFFFFFGDRLKNFCENLFFFFLESTCALCPWSLALASSIPVLGLESVCPRKGCPWPWPWPRIFFCVLGLGLGLEPCVLDSTSVIYLCQAQKRSEEAKKKKKKETRTYIHKKKKVYSHALIKAVNHPANSGGSQ